MKTPTTKNKSASAKKLKVTRRRVSERTLEWIKNYEDEMFRNEAWKNSK